VQILIKAPKPMNSVLDKNWIEPTMKVTSSSNIQKNSAEKKVLLKKKKIMRYQ